AGAWLGIAGPAHQTGRGERVAAADGARRRRRGGIVPGAARWIRRVIAIRQSVEEELLLDIAEIGEDHVGGEKRVVAPRASRKIGCERSDYRGYWHRSARAS